MAIYLLHEREADDLRARPARPARDDRSPRPPARDQTDQLFDRNRNSRWAEIKGQPPNFRDRLVIDFSRRQPDQFHVCCHERPAH